MKVLTVVGARPQFIKASPVSSELRKSCTEILVHTGQHYDSQMSDVFFQELSIPKPNYNLEVGSMSHGHQTSLMLQKLEDVMIAEKPNCVLVYGDTNSTLAGSLAASKLQIPIAHVEAGLRSFNRQMPEEINRVVTDHLSSLLFCPSDQAIKNLDLEGIKGSRVVRTGDVMCDALRKFENTASNGPKLLESLGLASKSFALVTIHRAENTDAPRVFEIILEALEKLSQEVPIVFPVHPRTQKLIDKRGKSPIHFTGPVGYLENLYLQKSARVVVTDSGGMQKESAILNTPCVTLREQTEWVELVKLGLNRLVPPTSSAHVLSGIRQSLVEKPDWSPISDLYGEGNSALTVVSKICELFA